jgi:hypothetical protein
MCGPGGNVFSIAVVGSHPYEPLLPVCMQDIICVNLGTRPGNGAIRTGHCDPSALYNMYERNGVGLVNR